MSSRINKKTSECRAADVAVLGDVFCCLIFCILCVHVWWHDLEVHNQKWTRCGLPQTFASWCQLQLPDRMSVHHKDIVLTHTGWLTLGSQFLPPQTSPTCAPLSPGSISRGQLYLTSFCNQPAECSWNPILCNKAANFPPACASVHQNLMWNVTEQLQPGLTNTHHLHLDHVYCRADLHFLHNCFLPHSIITGTMWRTGDLYGHLGVAV